jgi:hypothetical protein
LIWQLTGTSLDKTDTAQILESLRGDLVQQQDLNIENSHDKNDF